MLGFSQITRPRTWFAASATADGHDWRATWAVVAGAFAMGHPEAR